MSEHEQKNETLTNKEILTIKKDSLWKGAVAVLAVLFVVSLFTGGFGFVKNNNDNNNGNDNGGNPPSVVDLSPFMDKSLYPSIGPDNADTVVIEFSDFQCPFCAIASGLPAFAQQYSTGQYADLFGSAKKVEQLAIDGKLRFIYVSMSFLGEESVFASQAALCANQQGKFWEIHDAIFSAHDGQENNGKYSKVKLKVIAEGISGMNINTFSDCLDKDRTLSDVGVVSNTAQTAATGTPTFYVNGVKMSGSWNGLSAAINS